VKPAAGAEPRWRAARALGEVLDHGHSLVDALAGLEQEFVSARDRALVRRLCHRVLRDLPALEWRLTALLDKSLPRRARLVHFLLLGGLDQLIEDREPARAVVHSTVAAVRAQPKFRHLSGLVNAVLRTYTRRAEALETELPPTPSIRLGYPDWLLQAMRADWPEDWQAIARAGNRAPPLWLRVNRRRAEPATIAKRLREAGHAAETDPRFPDAVKLARRAAVSHLPGFEEGLFSIQDAGAQAAVELLDLRDGLTVLDACAAPGGKAAHILERAEVALTALELDPARARRIESTIDRLGLQARVKVGDAAQPAAWLERDGPVFDRILIDAPCSATGVIRRHPDIRWLRRSGDIGRNIQTQSAILEALWPRLHRGGLLVYVSCSILNAENRDRIRAFLDRHDDANIQPFELAETRPVSPGRQILPGSLDRDGFYHVVLRRL